MTRLLFILLMFTSLPMVSANTRSIAEIRLLADSCMEIADYSKYLEYSLEAVETADESHDCRLQSEYYYRLAIGYDYLKNSESAMHWLYKALATSRNCAEVDTTQMHIDRYLGAMYYGKQQADSCIYYLKASAQLMLNQGYLAEAASAHGMLGEAYSTIVKNPSEAVMHYQMSIQLAKTSGVKKSLGYAFFRYGCHLARNTECFLGKTFIDSSYVIFRQLKDDEGMRWALNGKAYAESRCGSGIAVYNYLTEIQNINDSLFRSETAKNAARYDALFEKDKKEREIAALEARARSIRIYTGIGIGVLFLLVAIGYLILTRRNLTRQRIAEQALHEVQLKSYRDVLDAENKERQRIASELHDSLGQLLSAARMNLSMVESAEPSLQKATYVIDEAAREVRQISHNLMPASLKELGLLSALRQMIRTMSPAGSPVITFDAVSYSKQSEDLEMALYRMIQELLTNSIRHGKSQNIRISIVCQNQELQLIIQDDGGGFDIQTNNNEGIGLKNIRTRCDMMKGTFKYESTPGQGSSFFIHLPL
jgi:two-component system, NarL family, sensor kinase